MTHPHPWVTVDCVVFDGGGGLLLVQRKNPPFQGQLALPGGFVEVGETTEAAALRELREETDINGVSLSLIGVYSDPRRDPRHHVIGIAYLVDAWSGEARAGDDASAVSFLTNWQSEHLAFDHRRIVEDALLIKGKP